MAKRSPANQNKTPAETPAKTPANDVGRQTAAPLCPVHQVPMVAGSSPPTITYYYCKVVNESGVKCGCTKTRPRPHLAKMREKRRLDDEQIRAQRQQGGG